MKYKSLCCLFLFTLQCKNPTQPQHVDAGQNLQAQNQASNSQCYDPSIKLNLATETYDTPVVTNPSISSNFPRILTFDTNQLYDHIEIHICNQNGAACKNTYALTAPAILPIEQVGTFQIKFEVCFNTTCSKQQILMINNTNISKDNLNIGSALILIADKLLSLAKQRLQSENNTAITPYVFLRMFNELYINQPQRLELADAQCSYTSQSPSISQPIISSNPQINTSIPTQTQVQTLASVNTSPTEESSTETGTGTSTTTNMFRLVSKYFGIGMLALTGALLTYNAVKAGFAQRDAVRKLKMFEEIRGVFSVNKENIEQGNFDKTIEELKVIKTKYGAMFLNDTPEGLLNQLSAAQEDYLKINSPKSGTKPLSDQEIARLNDQYLVKFEEIAKKIEDFSNQKQSIPETSKVKIKQYMTNVGKYSAALLVSGGFLAYETFGLADDGSNVKSLDVKIYNLLKIEEYIYTQY